MAKNNVLISVKPFWSALIFNGKKDFELRKTKPNLKLPFTCYVYCSTDISGDWDRYSFSPLFYNKENIPTGKVIGSFLVDRVYEVPCSDESYKRLYKNGSCVPPDKVKEYSKGEIIYAWHISKLTLFGEPKQLKCRPPQSWIYC